VKPEPQPRKQQVVSITSAATSHSEDLIGREWRYGISMGIRTMCFLGAVIASGPLRWALIAGALLLPYTSVILANAGVRKKSDGPTPFDLNTAGEIEPPSTTAPPR